MSEFTEIYKDFAIIHADAESALNLLRGLDEKLKKAIAANPPAPGDGDRYYQLYALRMNALDCTAALLRGFDSEFGQDILRRAEVAIAAEETEEEEAIALDEQEIHRLLLTLGGLLGGYVANTTADFSVGLDQKLRYLIGLAKEAKERKKARDNQLGTYLRKIQTTAINLLSMYFDADELDADGDFNEERDTLIAAAKDVILSALKEINNAQLPY